MWETLPSWVWTIYYLFLLITLGAAIFSYKIKRMKSLSVITIALAVTIPVISLLGSMERIEGANEWEHMWTQLQQGATWSVFVMIGYVFLVFWWILFFFTQTKNA